MFLPSVVSCRFVCFPPAVDTVFCVCVFVFVLCTTRGVARQLCVSFTAHELARICTLYMYYTGREEERKGGLFICIVSDPAADPLG